ncbi:L-asparaginase, type II [Clostridium celatum DSM 1785]|uniref:L-asparaginase, type II n=2 Tax=Clostridium celatum TaxID=36834 RepID=L1QF78_9CLOT|nr:L-asparaginase, type II [Clostridium celatum DSM 1785]
MEDKMKKIAVVFNGGTISMKVDERIKAAVPSLTGEEIMSMVTGIEEFAEIESYSFSSMPSPHMTFKTMIKLSKFIKELLERDDIDGVVITHGTDTLEETAYLLDLTINSNKPIVITGAMRSGSELGYDGPSNLAASICTAISDDAKGRGVLVCFNGELNSASEVTKANSMALNAFRTPNFGPIGIVDNNKVMFYRETKNTETYDVSDIKKDVALIKCVADMDSTLMDFVIEKGFGGIVIEGLGRGNVPPKMVEGIKRAIEKEVPVVIVSRCFEGRVHESYGYEGGGKMLKDLGVIFGDTLAGQKARIKLVLAINSGLSYEKIRDIF